MDCYNDDEREREREWSADWGQSSVAPPHLFAHIWGWEADTLLLSQIRSHSCVKQDEETEC